jgi:hypothetical protein
VQGPVTRITRGIASMKAAAMKHDTAPGAGAYANAAFCLPCFSSLLYRRCISNHILHVLSKFADVMTIWRNQAAGSMHCAVSACLSLDGARYTPPQIGASRYRTVQNRNLARADGRRRANPGKADISQPIQPACQLIPVELPFYTNRVYFLKRLLFLKGSAQAGYYSLYQRNFGLKDILTCSRSVDILESNVVCRVCNILNRLLRWVSGNSQWDDRNRPKPGEKKPPPRPDKRKPKPGREGGREQRDPRIPNTNI